MLDDIRSVKDRVDDIADAVIASLTPFQRATVEHVMNLYRDGRRRVSRVLVADEVGLGKTLVARGVTAEMVRLRRDEKDDLVKVAYVCSNSAIASQNIERLRIDAEIQLASSRNSRLSMQHLALAKEMLDKDLYNRYVQIIPLTPQTSFTLANSMGTLEERALMYGVLCYDPEIASSRIRKKRLNTLLWNANQYSSTESWRSKCERYKQEIAGLHKSVVGLKKGSGKPYPLDLIDMAKKELCEDEGLESVEFSHAPITFDSLLEGLDADDTSREFQRGVIISLRRAFSKASIDLMDPDFVIMDEFQRFRCLLSAEDSEESMLAKRFFSKDSRVLLLSATPFRMYSTSAELADGSFGDSYREFIEVIDFLAGEDRQRYDEFITVWGDYSRELASTVSTGKSAIVACRSKKSGAQDKAASFIARTERISTDELRSLADNATHSRPIAIASGDIKAFHAARELMKAAGVPEGLMGTDYIKSCPFPFSFMRDYVVKKSFDRGAREKWNDVERAATSKKRKDLLWASRSDIRSYRRLKVENSRYRQLEKDLFEQDAASMLLWVPASLPYYAPPASSVFSRMEHFTKTLVFSSWAMVPPALSTMISYEAERRNVGRLGENYQYFKSDDGNDGNDEDIPAEEPPGVLPHRRLALTEKNRNSFNIVYPSPYLASLFDGPSAGGGLTLVQLRSMVRKRIATDLASVLGIERLPKGRGRGDFDWYAMAALMLDEMYLGHGFDDFARRMTDGPKGWSSSRKNSLGVADNTMDSLFARYSQWRETHDLVEIPSDLVSVLADAAIGSPAVCALRAYGRLCAGGVASVHPALPFEFGIAFVRRMNTAPATVAVAAAMGEGTSREKQSAHWKRMLAYCCEGNLQAVLDEYAHLESAGKICANERNLLVLHDKMTGAPDADSAPRLHEAESHHAVETFDSFKANANREMKRRRGQVRLRTNYANAFMETRDAERGNVSRDKKRAAFNSPFWPFVLVSTSIGQEGLDFHQYCRRVVHWNLPSNPIDLEQREGRVNRYKGLSVRQNVADRYGSMLQGKRDIWGELFKIAEREETGISGIEPPSGLLPYWGVTDSDDMVKVERYVYSYPFSSDELRYEYLLNAVRKYRAVLGQPDQDELIALLERRFGDAGAIGENLSELFMNLCPFVRE